jgi:hypothetical protein
MEDLLALREVGGSIDHNNLGGWRNWFAWLGVGGGWIYLSIIGVLRARFM